MIRKKTFLFALFITSFLAAKPVAWAGEKQGEAQTNVMGTQPIPAPPEEGDSKAIACPMYVMRCPDGSFVSPSGPDCKVPPCPGGPPVAPSPAQPPAQPFKCPPNAVCATPITPLNPPTSASPDGSDTDDQDQDDQQNTDDDSNQSQSIPYGVNAGSAVAGVGVTGPGRVVNMADLGLSKYIDEPLNVVPVGAQTVKFIVEHRSALNDKSVLVRGIIVSALKGGCPPNTNPRMGMPCMQPRITLADSDAASRDTNYDLQIFLSMDSPFPYKQGQSVDIEGTVSGEKSYVTLRTK